jgi:hypothetical protein
MVPDFNSELIRNLSVKTVEGFLNDRVPLSVGIAKEASAHGFNPEQIKRTIEATNNIAYLKMLGEAQDRTFEFPVADYKEVLAHMVLPEGVPHIAESQKEVQASAQTPVLEKTAADTKAAEREFILGLSKQAQFKLIETEYESNRKHLEHLNGYSSILAEKLIKQAQLVGKDPVAMDKLASVTEEDQFTQLSYLVTGDVKAYRDLGSYGMFKEASLRDVKELAALHKEARQVVDELKERKANHARLEPMVKKAGFMGIGSSTPSPTISQAKPVAASAGEQVGSAVGKGIGKAVKTVAKAPLTVAKNIGAVGKFAAGPLLDAVAYDPGVNATTGLSNDVWSALH